MFIKRINKIYAPPKPINLNKPKSKVPPLSSQAQQKVETKVSQTSQIALKVHFISVDPHARLICLYCELYDTIYVVSILTLLNYINDFREQFNRTKQYSFKSCLKPDLIIQNPRPSLHIFQIKFSHCVQGTQFLVVVYYTGVIDVYSVVTGKRMDGLDITSGSSNLEQGVSPVYNVNVIGHSIFISTYDGKLLCYEGRQLGLCLKFEDEWVRLCYDFHEEREESKDKINTSKQELKRLKKVPLYQDKNNMLKLGHTLIQKKQPTSKMQPKQMQKKSRSKSSQKQKKVQNPIPTLTQSYEEYLRLQSQKVCPQGEHNKYTLSLCERFLVCYHEEELIIKSQYICPSFYTIRTREAGWAEFEEAPFCKIPVVNHFWGIGSGTKNKLKSQHNLMQECLNSKQILIATVGNYQFDNNKIISYEDSTDQRSLTVMLASKTKNNKLKLNFRMVSRLIQAKQDITEIWWIGPNMLVYVGQTGNLYYMQIDARLLID